MMHPCYQWLSTVTSQLYRFSLYFQQPTLKNLKCSLLLDWKGNEQTTWHFLTLLAFSQNVFCIIIHNAMSSALLFTTSFAFRIINHSIYIPHHHLWGLQHHHSWCFSKLCSLSLLHNHSQCNLWIHQTTVLFFLLFITFSFPDCISLFYSMINLLVEIIWKVNNLIIISLCETIGSYQETRFVSSLNWNSEITVFCFNHWKIKQLHLWLSHDICRYRNNLVCQVKFWK